MNRSVFIKELAFTGILLAAALIVGVIESLLPPVIPALPFVRLGLSNAVLAFTLVRFGLRPALLIAALKSILVPLFVGNPMMIAYSLPASVAALLVTAFLVRKLKTGLPLAGVFSAGTHNLVQLFVAWAMTGSPAVFGFLPYLFLIGTVAGVATGAAGHWAVQKIPAQFGVSR